jgi:tRNA1(Val) A37 N6-methylase TrmN6
MSEGEKASATDLLGGRLRLMQPAKGYRTAIDPVLLAAAAPETGWTRALDVGAGTGAVMLCLLARVGHGQVTGLECLEEHAALAEASLALNGLEARGAILRGDVLARPAPVPANAFDLVLTNPPYHGPGSASPHPGRAAAHREAVPLDAWVRFCLRALRPGGRLCLIHRADRLDALLAALSGKAGAVEILPLWPKAGRPAKRVILRAIKGRGTPPVLLPGLVLHAAAGGYTMAAEKVLREGLSLDAALDVY